MYKSSCHILRAIVCTGALLALSSQSRAGGNVGDDTNAASISANDGATWGANMQHVMGGAKTAGTGNHPALAILAKRHIIRKDDDRRDFAAEDRVSLRIELI